jgi:hypothetical protein
VARYYHGGPNAVDPEREALLGIDDSDSDRRRKNAGVNHRLTRPHETNLLAEIDSNGEKKLYLKVPPAFWRYNRIQLGDAAVNQVIPDSMRVEWQPGSITLALPDIGFWVVFPGGSITVPDYVSPATVKSIAPHLLTEAEALERGIAQPAVSPVKSPQKSPKA